MDLRELIVILGSGIAVGAAAALLAERFPRLQVEPVRSEWVAVLLVLAWSGLVGTLAVLQHLSFHTGAYDLGIFDQTIWNSAQGRLFESSVTFDSPNRLGQHFSPILLALVPFYWVYPSPLTLVVVQALLLGFTGLPVYWLARDTLRSQVLALAFLLAYLLQPATSYVALSDFHELAIAAPLLSAALYLLLRRRYALFGIALAFVFLTKEDLGLVGAAMGVFVIVFQRRWRLGLGLFAAGTLWTFVLVRWVIPSFSPTGGYYYTSRYADLGSTYREMLTNVLWEPGRLPALAFAPNRLTYLQQLFAPLGGLPLLGWPLLVIALPSFAETLLASGIPSALIRLHYSATLLPTLLMASVVGLGWLRGRLDARRPVPAASLAAFVLTAAFAGAYLYGPLPLARGFDPSRFRALPRDEVARQLMAQIPPEASVIAQSNFVPHLSHRRSIQPFAFAEPSFRPDYYLLDTDPSAFRFPLPQGDDGPYLRALTRVTADAEYTLLADRDGYLLFGRETPDPGVKVDARFGDQITLVGYKLATETVAPGGDLRLTLYWQATRPVAADYTLFVHLVGPDGKKWGQKDGYPTSEYLPTSQWEPGRLLRANWVVTLAPDAPPGQYRVVAGLYSLATMKRLGITRGGEPAGDSITLQNVTVPGKP